jgi:DNA-directed RNA polymerase specialized sigma subunit
VHKLEKSIKDLENKLKNKNAIEIELKELNKEKLELDKITETINNMDERAKIILTRICINGELPQNVGQVLNLKPRQIYYLKKDALKSLISKLSEE